MSTIQHPLTWFEQRLGKVVNRNGKTFEIKNQATANYCHELQESGFKFEDPKPKVKLHTVPEAICTACEG